VRRAGLALAVLAAVGVLLTGILVVFGGAPDAAGWFLGVDSTSSPRPAAEGACDYPTDTLANVPREVGRPPAAGVRTSGTVTAEVRTNRGTLRLELDPTAAPCAVHSFAFLALVGFYDDTPCHRLVTKDLYAVQCGDPSGSGTGGPGYRFADENLPTSAGIPYRSGTVAMANAGPDTNGSQFFVAYQDCVNLPPEYPVIGRVVEGLDILLQVASGGVRGQGASSPDDGRPRRALTILQVKISAKG
jgi:cyclophilin family peptidyl-prolyl cis-trans isomerase